MKESRISRGWWGQVGVGIFCGLLLIPSVIWLWRDVHVWDWDPSEYGYFAIDLWRTLWTEPRLWPWMFFHAVGPKAPDLIWAAQFLLPLRHVMGSAENVFHLINLAIQWGSLFLLWRCVRRATGENWVAFAACLWLAGMPLFVGMSQDFLTEPLQMFAVMFIWFIAVSGDGWSASKLAAFLLIGGGLVLGSKASTPAYCFVPGVYALHLLWRSVRGRHWGLNIWNGLGMVAGLLHLGILGIWYASNRDGVLGKFVGASSGGEGCVVNEFGYKDTFVNKMVYWATWLKRSVTFDALAFLLVLAVAALAIAWILVIRGGKLQVARTSVRLAVLAGAQFAVVWIMLSANIATLIRYVYAAIPSLLLCLACGAGMAGGAVTRRWVIACVGIWWVGSQALLTGTVPCAETAQARHWAAPERDPARIRQVRRLVEMLNVPRNDGVYHLCGTDFPWLSGSTLNYYAALDSLDSGCRTQFGRLGSPPTELERAWERVHGELGYYIAASDPHMEGRVDGPGRIMAEVLRRIRRDPRFVPEVHGDLPDLLLFRNVSSDADRGGEGRP